jgi:hypothetical protein
VTKTNEGSKNSEISYDNPQESPYQINGPSDKQGGKKKVMVKRFKYKPQSET